MPIESTAARPAAAPITINIPGFGPSRRVTARDRKFFTEQLALMLETGSSLVAALELMTAQASSPALAETLTGVTDGVKDGATLAAALAAYPEAFPGTYATLIKAAEDGGYLERALRHLLTMEENREELRATLTSAFTYPAFLIVFSVAVVLFILGVVFPKFAVLFESIADQLPTTTLVLMAASNVISQHGAWLALASVALLGAAGWFATRPGASAAMHRVAERVPGVRDLLMQFYLIQSMRILSLSLANGVTLVEALHACRGVVASPAFNAFLQRVHHEVTEGKGFAAGFSAGAFVPPLARQMIATGEEAGRLELVTRRIADHYQTLLERRLEMLSKLVEPLMLLVMGVVVGVIVSSLILPIFKISRAVH